jgi:hypothetical protein
MVSQLGDTNLWGVFRLKHNERTLVRGPLTLSPTNKALAITNKYQ